MNLIGHKGPDSLSICGRFNADGEFITTIHATGKYAMPDLPPLPVDAPQPFSRYKHWKDGSIATVIRVGRHSETKEPMVIYDHLGEVWTRPLAMWADEARPGITRFTKCPESEQPHAKA